MIAVVHVAQHKDRVVLGQFGDDEFAQNGGFGGAA